MFLSMLSNKKITIFLFVIVSSLGRAAYAAECPAWPVAPTPEQLQQLSATAQDRGFLWKISKQGHDSWLYGTLHVGKLAWVMPGPAIIDALRTSEFIALELDISDPATNQKLAELSHRGAGHIPESLKARVKQQLDSVCLPATTMNELSPEMLFSTIEVLSARRQGLEIAYGVETVLAGYAHASKKTVIALETPESQMAALQGDSAAVDPQDIVDSLQQLESGHSARVVGHLAQAWSEGKIAELEQYPSWCQCLDTASQRMEFKKLLDDRNGPLADSIDALHRQGKMVFAAVGALHMTGDKGLPALLKQKGYTVSPVIFNSK